MKALFPLLVMMLVGLGACGGPKTGPQAIHYDRDVCEQCRMIISDPHFAAEVRGKDGVLHRFDDIGGAVLWMKAHGGPGAQAEVWVMNMRDGQGWLDARTAYFVADQTTPMDFGFGAIAEKTDKAVDFDAMVRSVLARPKMGMDMKMGSGQ